MLGPVEVAVIEFEGNQFKGEIAPAMREVVDRGIVRIIDLLFIWKDREGTVRSIELDDIDPEIADAMSPLTDEVMGLLSEDDARRIGEQLHDNCSAAMIVFEHAWLRRLRHAIANANGRLVSQERIPADVVDRALAAQDAGPA
jgi:hypothetical protein